MNNFATMKRPWHKYSTTKPWMEQHPRFGTTRHHTPGYNSRRWRRLREKVLNYHQQCEMCESAGKLTIATMVDHRISISDGGKMWDEDNLQALCSHCHRIKTNKEIANRKRQGYGKDM